MGFIIFPLPKITQLDGRTMFDAGEAASFTEWKISDRPR